MKCHAFDFALFSLNISQHFRFFKTSFSRAIDKKSLKKHYTCAKSRCIRASQNRCHRGAVNVPHLALAEARTTFLRNIGPRASEELSFEMGGLGQAGWRSEGVTQSNGDIFNFCHWSNKILKVLVYIRCQNEHFV